MPSSQKMLQVEFDRFAPIQFVNSNLNLSLQLGRFCPANFIMHLEFVQGLSNYFAFGKIASQFERLLENSATSVGLYDPLSMI